MLDVANKVMFVSIHKFICLSSCCLTTLVDFRNSLLQGDFVKAAEHFDASVNLDLMIKEESKGSSCVFVFVSCYVI